MQPKFRLHHVDTRFGRVWRVVFPDGFAVRFTSWERAKNYTFDWADGKFSKRDKVYSTDGKLRPKPDRPVRSETLVGGWLRNEKRGA